MGNKLSRDELDELERRQIIKRQMKLESKEINQNWYFVYGLTPPQSELDCSVIDKVTLRNIWYEDNFIFNKIKALKPNEVNLDRFSRCLYLTLYEGVLRHGKVSITVDPPRI